MSSGAKHLSAEQIGHLVEAQFRSLESEAHSELLEQARLHLTACEGCRRLVSMQQELDKRIRQIREVSTTEPGQDCPSEETLKKLAAGATSPDRVDELLEHVTQCDHCGPLFKASCELFSDSSTPEEQSSIAALKSSDPEWQANLLRQLTPSNLGINKTVTERPGWSWERVRSWRLLLPSAGLVALSAAAVVLVISNRQPSIERMLSDAYAENGTLEIQIPGAPHTVSKATRGKGKGKSGVERPALAAAEVRIARELARSPGNPMWLQAKGRAELLEGNPDAAIDSFERAREISPELPSLLTDFGAAYYEKAEKYGVGSDYPMAIEYFSRAISKNSADQAALFNRAIALEKTHLYEPAVQDWENYLRLFPHSEWSDEARKKLNALHNSQKSSRNRAEKTLMNSVQLRARQDRLGISETEDAIGSEIESYLELATTEWLVQTAERSDDSDHRDMLAAIQLVSGAAVLKNGDRWLEELSKDSSSPVVLEAIRALRASILWNSKGDFSGGVREARRAGKLFRRGRSAAGELRARLEEAYSLKLSDQGKACLTASSEGEKITNFEKYRWVAIRLEIEKGDCLSLVGNLGEGLSVLVASRRAAELAGFRTSYLRATAFIADIEVEIGNWSSGWKTIADGLTAYEEGSYPPMRGYNLYASMDELADAEHLWYLQTLVWRQAITTIQNEDNPLLKAMAYSRLGSATLMAGQLEESVKAFQQSRALLANAPRSDATKSREIDVEVWLARTEARQVHPEQGVELLHSIESELRKLSSDYVTLDYYTALGEIEWRRERYQEAREALDQCIQVSKKTLRSLQSEEDRIRWIRTSSSCYRLSVELYLRQGKIAHGLELWEQYLAAPLRHAARTNSVLVQRDPVHVLRESLEHSSKLGEHTRISVAVFDDGIGVWVYDNHEIRGKLIPLDRGELIRKVNAFTKLCADPDSDIGLIRQKGAAVYELLFGSIADWLPRGGSLIVEVDESLSGAPLEALVDPQGRYLAESHAFVWSPGLYYPVVTKAQKQPITKSRAVIVASPAVNQFDDEMLDPIPDALAEGKSLAGRFSHATLVVGKSATVRRVSKELTGAEVFHYAGHAVIKNQRPGLLLVSDMPEIPTGSLLTADMVRRLRLDQMQIAVLAACSTQNGSEGGAFDPDSLSRAFLRAGARQVVSSRWNVDSQSTSTLLEYFYTELLSGMTVSEALQEAQEAIRMNEKTTHPFFWAGFAVIGDT